MPVSDGGCFIAFEGVEGSGKSTHLHRAAEALRARQLEVVETREPGGTPLGRELRNLLMHRLDLVPAPLTELLLYLADRAQHLADVIQPALARGAVVLTDRFSASTIAYQGFARRLDVDTVSRLDALVRRGVAPHRTVLLDCPAEVGLRRAQGVDRFHAEQQEFHERVRAGFLSLAEHDPQHYCIIDATRPLDEVHAAVMAAVTECLQQR